MQYHKPTFDSLIKLAKKNNHQADVGLIEKAFDFAVEKHKGTYYRTRPFVEHLLNTAYLVCEINLDEIAICAALLHNVLDDGKTGEEEIFEKFGKQILTIIKEYEKIKEIEDTNIEKIPYPELSNILLGTVSDVRTLFIKLVTRIDSLRNIKGFTKKEQLFLAKTAMNIYAPICHKLGVYSLKWELEDLSFKTLEPEAYNKLKEQVNEKRPVREKLIGELANDLSKKLSKEKLNSTIYGRPKHFYGIYKKSKKMGKPISELPDLLAVRIICDSLKECYEILGIIHSQYEYLPQYFDDYIAVPKPNGYKSIHTTVKFKNKVAEIQIRTWEMHRDAEDGLAAHWQYKQYAKNQYFDKELSIAKQLVEWQQYSKDAKGLAKFLKIGFEGKKIFVFTPKKEVIVLPEKSTPIDFAFAIHSDVGKKCQKALVNGKIVSLDHQLQNADCVEILTSKKPEAKRQWLSFVQSEKARIKLKQFLGISEKFKPNKKTVAEINLPESALRIAKCCSPIPGDETIGVKTTKRKVMIHRKECENIRNVSKKMIVKISLGEKENYEVKLKIFALDAPGVLPNILNKIIENRATIISTNTNMESNKLLKCQLAIKIKNILQLEKIKKDIQSIPTVSEVERS